MNRAPDDLTQGTRVGDYADDPTRSPKTGGHQLDVDPTRGRGREEDLCADPTHGRRTGSAAGEDPTQGRTSGALPGEDPTQAR